MYKATWHELVCPVCDTTNFVCDGDFNDPARYIVEHVQCSKCNHCFDFGGNSVEDSEWCTKGTIFKEIEND